MTVENFKRAQEIAGEIGHLNKIIQRVDGVRVNRDFKISDGDYSAYIEKDVLDPAIKEGVKALISSHLQNKVKQLEAEFESL